MNPLGMRPDGLLNHLINPLQDGTVLQFVDQPDRTIKCYNSALGKGIPLYESGKVYYVKKSDLTEALGLNDASTEEELNTELIWHMIQTASDDFKASHVVTPGAKEYLIGKYYQTQNVPVESTKWMLMASQKEHLPAELEVALTLPGLSDEQQETLKALLSLVTQDDTNQFVEDAVSAMKWRPLRNDLVDHYPAAERALKTVFARCDSIARAGNAAAIDVLFAYIYNHPQSPYLLDLISMTENLIPQMNDDQKINVLRFLKEFVVHDPSYLPKMEGIALAISGQDKQLINITKFLIHQGCEKIKVKARELLLKPENMWDALHAFENRENMEKMLTAEECLQFDRQLLQGVSGLDQTQLDAFHDYFHYQNASRFQPKYLIEQYTAFLASSSPKHHWWVKKLYEDDTNHESFEILQRLADQGDHYAHTFLIAKQLRAYLEPCTIEKIQSPEFDQLIKQLAITNYRAGGDAYYAFNLMLYFIPPAARPAVFKEAPTRGDVLQLGPNVLMDRMELRTTILEGIDQFFEWETDSEFKNAVIEMLDLTAVIRYDYMEISKRILKHLCQSPKNAFQILTGWGVKSFIDVSEIDAIERLAVEYALLADEDTCFNMMNYFIRGRSDGTSRFNKEHVAKLAIHGSQTFKLHSFFSVVWQLAQTGDQAALHELRNYSNYPLESEAASYLEAYELCQWVAKQNISTLRNLDLSSSPIVQASNDARLLLMSYHKRTASISRHVTFPDLDRDDHQMVHDYLLIHLAQIDDQYIPQLRIMTPPILSDAIQTLTVLAEKGNPIAIRELNSHAYLSFMAQCTVATLNTDAYDKTIETALIHEIAIHPFAKILYLTPLEMRASLFDPTIAPNQIIKEDSLQSPYADEPALRKALAENIRNKFSQELHPAVLKMIATYVVDKFEELGLHEDDPIMQNAIAIVTSFEAGGWRNPVRLFNRLIEDRRQPNLFIPPLMAIEGKPVRFDLPAIQVTVTSMAFPRSLLHPDVTWENWQHLIQQIEKKKDDPEVKQAIDDQTLGGWSDLKTLCLDDDAFFKPRIEFQGNPVPINYAQLNAILHRIFTLSDQGHPLSEKEERLIQFAESVKNCPGGKFEGVSLYYTNGLEQEDKFPLEIPNEPDPAKANAKSVLAEQYQNFLSEAFSGNNPLMAELTGSQDIQQASHQAIYLKNLIAHIVGLQHTFHFDRYSFVLYDKLVSIPRDEVLKIFFERYTPQTLVDHLHAWMVRDSEVYARKNWDKLFTLVTPADEDMIWDPDTDLPLDPTKIYARKLLEAAGYLTGGENEPAKDTA